MTQFMISSHVGDVRPDGDPKETAELLDRLKIVKVTSHDPDEEPITKSTRPLPQERRVAELSTYGFEEPKTIPEGKCSLKQSLEFITKYQNDPGSNPVESIAQDYKMKKSDVENIVTNFRVFELFVSSDGKKGVAQGVLDSIGVNKVIQPMFKPKFADLEKHALPQIKKENAIEQEK
ncbi:hypothetical protein JTE90_006663 [Oedothorax gibbosus]|uniref:Uncharacterized protein n=1 Tax=Oedothorax gibbosus TaxID=931172 RepID=A0AAV6V1V8_9ARAC|nr:hypothetical protein JTE90_006663 [Oedothorax gibbosus]